MGAVQRKPIVSDRLPISSVELFSEVTKIGGGILAITEMNNNNKDKDASKKED